jgi:hypothetical protein
MKVIDGHYEMARVWLFWCSHGGPLNAHLHVQVHAHVHAHVTAVYYVQYTGEMKAPEL